MALDHNNKNMDYILNGKKQFHLNDSLTTFTTKKKQKAKLKVN